MHEGVPVGGALVRELLASANATAGNGAQEPGIEAYGALTVVARGGEVEVGLEDGTRLRLADGEAVDVPAPRAFRVRYVAVRGGLEVPEVLGGRGTLAVAGFGGHEGRALRRGDRLAVGTASMAVQAGEADASGAVDLDTLIRVVVGPDSERFEQEAGVVLLSETYAVLAASDRVGSRLGGPELARLDGDDSLAAPMAAGAIQVPSSGAPIVLGPDHPTTGGYPVIAVVVRRDLGRFFARPIGAHVRFVRWRGD